METSSKTTEIGSLNSAINCKRAQQTNNPKCEAKLHCQQIGSDLYHSYLLTAHRPPPHTHTRARMYTQLMGPEVELLWGKTKLIIADVIPLV